MAFVTRNPRALLHFFFQDNRPLHYKRKCRHWLKKCMLWGQLTDYCSWNSILQPQVSLAQRQSWSTFFCPCTSIPRWPCSSKQKVDLNLIMTSVLSHHVSDKKKLCCSPTWLNSCATLGKGTGETEPTSGPHRRWQWPRGLALLPQPGSRKSFFTFRYLGHTPGHPLDVK